MQNDQNIPGNRDVAWLVLAIIGAAAIYLALDFEIGTISNIGSAIYPMILAGIILVISLWSFAFSRDLRTSRLNGRALGWVAASVLVFILLIDSLGLVPTVIVSMLLAYAGQTERRYRFFIAYAVLFAFGAWLLFSLALGLPLPPFRMP